MARTWRTRAGRSGGASRRSEVRAVPRQKDSRSCWRRSSRSRPSTAFPTCRAARCTPTSSATTRCSRTGASRGVIDFYFAGVDCLLYDVAVCANDWCLVDPRTDAPGRGAHAGAARRLPRGAAVHARSSARPGRRCCAPRRCASGFRACYDFHLPRPGMLVHAHDPEHFRHVLESRIAEPARLDAPDAGAHRRGAQGARLARRRLAAVPRRAARLARAGVRVLAHHDAAPRVVPFVGIAAASVMVPAFSVGFMAGGARRVAPRAGRARRCCSTAFASTAAASSSSASIYLACLGAVLVGDHAGRRRRARALDADRPAPGRGGAAVRRLPGRARLRRAALRAGADDVLVRAAARRLARASAPVKALFFSFFACLMNWRAFLAYGAVSALVALVAAARRCCSSLMLGVAQGRGDVAGVPAAARAAARRCSPASTRATAIFSVTQPNEPGSRDSLQLHLVLRPRDRAAAARAPKAGSWSPSCAASAAPAAPRACSTRCWARSGRSSAIPTSRTSSSTGRKRRAEALGGMRRRLDEIEARRARQPQGGAAARAHARGGRPVRGRVRRHARAARQGAAAPVARHAARQHPVRRLRARLARHRRHRLARRDAVRGAHAGHRGRDRPHGEGAHRAWA